MGTGSILYCVGLPIWMDRTCTYTFGRYREKSRRNHLEAQGRSASHTDLKSGPTTLNSTMCIGGSRVDSSNWLSWFRSTGLEEISESGYRRKTLARWYQIDTETDPRMTWAKKEIFITHHAVSSYLTLARSTSNYLPAARASKAGSCARDFPIQLGVFLIFGSVR